MEHTIIPISLERGPIPLFHQIAESLRYYIATGRLEAGDRLPSVRRAAEAWGVNLHTVRRAYSELTREGLVETKSPTGTRVTDQGLRSSQSDRANSATEAFLAQTIEEARGKHGLSIGDLVVLLRDWSARSLGPPTVHVIECSLDQARGHCREIEDLWRVRAVPWSLDNSDDDLPQGDLIATYFHYSEIKSRWSDRLNEFHFVPIQPDPSLADRIPNQGPHPITLPLCEKDEGQAVHIASDLRSFVPDYFKIEPRVVVEADELLVSGDYDAVLLSPRLWGSLSEEKRDDPRAFEVRYIINSDSLEALGRRFDWLAVQTEHLKGSQL
jgi:DNA-binding transcriptional regulator YhcF (GntR family)